MVLSLAGCVSAGVACGYRASGCGSVPLGQTNLRMSHVPQVNDDDQAPLRLGWQSYPTRSRRLGRVARSGRVCTCVCGCVWTLCAARQVTVGWACESRAYMTALRQFALASNVLLVMHPGQGDHFYDVAMRRGQTLGNFLFARRSEARRRARRGLRGLRGLSLDAEQRRPGASPLPVQAGGDVLLGQHQHQPT